MSKRAIIILSIVSVLFTFTSCSDYLDKTPDEEMTLDEIFASRQHTERFLSSVFNSLPEETSFKEDFGDNPFVGASDEMELCWTFPFSQKMNSGAWNPSNLTDNAYRRPWEGIRKCNLFLENIGKTPMDQTDKDIWIGEVYFLRAFYHFIALRTHGAIPMQMKSFNPNDDFSSVQRTPFDKCVELIVSDCEKAIASEIPAKYDANTQSSKLGHPTKGAAYALKSRVLLYAASPLFNGNPDYKNIVNKDGTRLFPDEDLTKWQKAADAAKECIDAAEAAGYELFYSADGDPLNSYKQLFQENWNSEVLFALNKGERDNSKYVLFERDCFPNGMSGWSGYNPTQEQVDAYHMENGELPITGYNADGSPQVNPAANYVETGYVADEHPLGYYPRNIRNMYAHREARFYASISYNGVMFKGRRLEFWKGGMDGQKAGNPDYTATGYLQRKMVNEEANIAQWTGWKNKTWIYFRLAEIYLNYAEALNEAQGPVDDVHKYVNKVRTRAGLPDLPTNLDYQGMKDRIRAERRVELAFETHRYFDTRRWKIAETTDGGYIHGMNINYAGTSVKDDRFYERTKVEKRVFEKKHYLFPYPQTEIDKIPTLVQNFGWSND